MMVEFNIGIEGRNATADVLGGIDKDKNGVMTFEEFAKIVCDLDPDSLSEGTSEGRPSTPALRSMVGEGVKSAVYDSREGAERGFAVFDKDGGGDITFLEFRDGIASLGLPIQPKQVSQLYAEMMKSRNEEGKLTLEDFAASLGMNIQPRVKEIPRWDKMPPGTGGYAGGGGATSPNVQTLNLDAMMSHQQAKQASSRKSHTPKRRPVSSMGVRTQTPPGLGSPQLAHAPQLSVKRPMSSAGFRNTIASRGRPQMSAKGPPPLSKLGADLFTMHQTGKANWQEEYSLGQAQNYQGPRRQLGLGGMMVT